MGKQTRAHQLSLFEDVPPGPAAGLDGERWRRCQKSPLHVSQHDQEMLREWLMEWGKRNRYPGFSFPYNVRAYTDPLERDRRFGRMIAGEVYYKKCVQPPYNNTEWYAGEWLVKCVEHCKRFDAGVQTIPPQSEELELSRSHLKALDEEE